VQAVRGPHPLSFLVIAAALVVLGACGDTDSGSASTGTTFAPDHPPQGVGAVVNWEDPTKVVDLGDGWAIRACEGEAPLLCVELSGRQIGVVEALSYPVSSFEDLDPDGDPKENLDRFGAGFIKAIGSDRAVGCGPDYGFDPFPVEDFVLGGTPGVSFGFLGTMPSGKPSELNLQYATIVGDRVLSIVAIAYDEGGCPGRDELSGFDSVTLRDFRPRLEEVLHESPLPNLVETPVDVGY
jgi:hypothetical protein